MILGIDFGTCYSSVAVMVGENAVSTTFFKEQSELGIPSKFLYHDGKKYFGIQCESIELKDYREEVIDEMKKKIRERPENIDVSYPSGGKNHMLKKIIKDYLEYLITHAVEDAKEAFGLDEDEKIEEITVAMPAGTESGKVSASIYGDFLVEVLKSIVPISGDTPENHIHVQIEPCMAAMSYLYRSDIRTEYEDKKTILVFDLGGGTFDVTLVEYEPLSLDFEIIDVDGDLNLGGYKWDESLEDYVCSKYGITIPEGKEKAFRDQIVNLKISLSKKEKSYIIVEDERKYQNRYEITREEFESATRKHLDQVLNRLKVFVQDNNILLSELDKIVLVGGSSNMPQIKNGILETFPSVSNDQIELYNASTAISQGAARYSKICNTSADGVVRRIKGGAPHTYGIRVFDPDSDSFKIFNVIFTGDRYGPDGKIHAAPGLQFYPPSFDKTRIRVRIFESDEPHHSGLNGDFMDDLGEESFTGMEAMLPVPSAYLAANEDFNVYIEMDLNHNGILELTFVDAKTDKRTKVKLKQKRR